MRYQHVEKQTKKWGKVHWRIEKPNNMKKGNVRKEKKTPVLLSNNRETRSDTEKQVEMGEKEA